MSYRKITSFAVKDTMVDANPLKVIRGKEFDDEFDAIVTSMDAQEASIANLVTTPTGGVVMFAASAAPSGFLLCDGAARSRNTYAALFQVIGVAYGAGDGATTFNLPNLTGRFPYGAPVGQSGGTADAVLPAHTHAASVSVNDPGHNHNWPYLSMSGTNPGSGSFAGGAGATQLTSSSPTGITATAAITSAGVSATNANLPPFLGLSFIIKI